MGSAEVCELVELFQDVVEVCMFVVWLMGLFGLLFEGFVGN